MSLKLLYEKVNQNKARVIKKIPSANESVTKTRRRIKIKSEINKIEIKITKIKEAVIETITKIISKTHEIVIVKIDLIVIKIVKTLARDVKIVKIRSIL